MSWKDNFVNIMDLEQVAESHPDIVDKVFSKVFVTPEGYKWEFLWSGEGENGKQADDLAMLLIRNCRQDDAFSITLSDGSYACGHRVTGGHLDSAFVEWGIGDSGASAASEIWQLVPVE